MHEPPGEGESTLARAIEEAGVPSGAQVPPEEIRRERQIIGPLLLASAAGFLFLTWVAARPRPNRVDVAITRALQRPTSRWFFRLMRLVSAPGYAPFTHTAVLAAAANFWSVGYRLESVCSVATMAAGFVTGILKMLVKRPRPDPTYKRMLIQLKDNSFPSGHATHYTSFYGYLFFMAYRRMAPSPLRSLILTFLAALILLVGPSRVYLGHHWASDVVAGELVGLTYLFGMLQVYLYLEDLTT